MRFPTWEEYELLEKCIAKLEEKIATAQECIMAGQRVEYGLAQRCQELEEQNQNLRWVLTNLPVDIYERIKHGDDQHKAWLKAELERFFADRTAFTEKDGGT